MAVDANDLRNAILDIRHVLNAEDDMVIRERFRAYPAASVLSYNFREADMHIEEHSLGRFGGRDNDKICPHCRAIRFSQEKSHFCCGVDAKLSPLAQHFQEPPEPIQRLYNENGQFLRDIKFYNDALCLATFHCEGWDRRAGGAAHMMSIQGRVWHNVGNLRRDPVQRPFPGQLYFYDGDAEQIARERAGIINARSVPNWEILAILQEELRLHNRYVVEFKHVIELHLQTEQEFDLKLIAGPPGRGAGHERSWNLPGTNEMAGIIVGDFSQEQSNYTQIILHYRHGGSPAETIHYYHHAYDPLAYPLLFPHGDDGWHNNMYVPNPKHPGERIKVTLLDWAHFRIQIRAETFNLLGKSRRLFQQWIIDAYAKIEASNLNYQRTHQATLRREAWANLDVGRNDALQYDDVGTRVMLGPSFYGGPRHKNSLFQDAMAITGSLGAPDYFITFTCNPNWPEITDNLFKNPNHGGLKETYLDRPDLCNRVFNLKLKSLMTDLVDNHFFGHAIAHVYSIEFQKRGLPHAHLLLFVADEDKPTTKAVIDRVISAEIPDPQQSPRLHDLVVKHMLHGPCGADFPRATCMAENKCSKEFPKEFRSETTVYEDSYPKYCRRSPHNDQGGQQALRGPHNQFLYDNSWVVPYNPTLLLRYNCHINVEVVNCLSAIKYLFKYIHKGVDQARIILEQREGGPIVIDEITLYQAARYLSASEAAWRIQGFKIHSNFPNVVRLDIHLENMQAVVWGNQEELHRLQEPCSPDILR